jgi:hypothetical protein
VSFGAIYLSVRKKFGYGPRVAWYRDVVRPRILQTSPVVGNTDKQCEIHVLTSAQDCLNSIWALKSFYAACRRPYALCIHDDGTLTAGHLGTLAKHFPDARIITKAHADAAVLPTLEPYPRCLEFRRTNHLAPKLFDFTHFLQSDRMLLLDSDVLFFREPTALLQRIENPGCARNCFNRDDETAYTISAEAVGREFGFMLQTRVNSGLGLIHKASLPLEWLEEFLAIPGLATGHFWRIEQTLYALCSSRFGVELLPEAYTVHLAKGLGDSPCRHYVGAVRHLLYSEGIRALVRGRTFMRTNFSKDEGDTWTHQPARAICKL